MLARLRKSTEEKDQGFTLIELLVVMIIIGILAAIAIPVFLSQRKKAQDSAAKADVSTVGKELATYYVDGTVPPTGLVQTGAVKRYQLQAASGNVDLGKVSNNVVLDTMTLGTTTGGADPATNWCVSVKNNSGDVAKSSGYKYSAAGGLETGTC